MHGTQVNIVADQAYSAGRQRHVRGRNRSGHRQAGVGIDRSSEALCNHSGRVHGRYADRHTHATDVHHHFAGGVRAGASSRNGHHRSGSHSRNAGIERNTVDRQAEVCVGLGGAPHLHQDGALAVLFNGIGLGADRADGAGGGTAGSQFMADQQQAARHPAHAANGAAEVDLGGGERHQEVEAQQVCNGHVNAP